MKKSVLVGIIIALVSVLLLLFIVILGIGSYFLIGNNTTDNNSVPTDFDDVYYDEPDTTPYEPQGFAEINRFDIMLEIIDYNIDGSVGENYVITDTLYGTHGYYLEQPYSAPVQILPAHDEMIYNDSDWLDIWTSRERLRNFEFVDDFTLFIDEGTYFEEESIIIEEIIYSDDLCSIFIAKKDKYGIENDTKVCYFAFNYSDIVEFETAGTGAIRYGQSATLSERKIYF